MKIIRYVLFALLLACAPSAFARDAYGFSISIGSPGYYLPPPPMPYYAPPPVVYYPAPTSYYRYYSPAPRAYYPPRIAYPRYYSSRPAHGSHGRHGPARRGHR